MKQFHVMISVDNMPLQFDVAETVHNGDLTYDVSHPGHGAHTMFFDKEQGEYKFVTPPGAFWQKIEKELSCKIQFENL